jgi:hypothetical protein
MTTQISLSELEHLSDLELRSKFNEVAEQLAQQQNEYQILLTTLRNIQSVIHRRRSTSKI